jgi:hypothetical protein
MKRVRFTVVALAWLVVLCPSDGRSDSGVDLKVFGHQIVLTGTVPPVEGPDPKLLVDGRELISAPYLTLREVLMIGDVGVIIGSSFQGGNACDAAPFVISFPGGDMRFDGPLEACGFSYSVEGQTITFRTMEEVFAWKAGTGFTALGAEGLSVDETAGWAELRRRDVNHPSELLVFGQIAKNMDALLGTKAEEYKRLIRGVGSGKFIGDTYVGQACKPHACPDEGALLVADIQRQQVFLAWKLEKESVAVRPRVNEWPENAKSALRNWADQWKR